MENNNPNSIKFHFTNSRFVPDDATKGLFTFLIFQTLVTLVYNVLYMVGLVQSIWSYVFTLILDFCFVACVYSVSKAKKIDLFTNLKVKKAPSIKQIAICVAISVICLFGFSGLTNLFMEILYRLGYNSVISDISIPNFGSYLMYVGLICVVPAICEEILFRGLICNGFKRLGTLTSVLGSAFLFMIMHGSPDQTVHQFILGIILALVFLVSNNLWVPIIIHFLNNFIAVTISYISYGNSAEVSNASTETVEMFLTDYLIYAVISAGISAVLIYLLLKALSKCKAVDKNIEPVDLKPSASSVSEWRMDYFRQADQDLTVNIETANESVPLGETIDVKAEEYVDPVFKVDENKLSGGGKAMLIISIVWLAIDWISALILGFNGMF